MKDAPEPISKTSLGDLLRNLRGSHNLSLAELAKRAGFSPSYILYLEQGKPKRVVRMDILESIADALDLSRSDKDSLLRASGHVPVSESLENQIQRTLHRVLVGLVGERREEFRDDLEAFVEKWRNSLRIRKQAVQRAVIPAAGWQTALLNHETLQKTLLPAVAEAVHAKLIEVVLVVAPGTPELGFLRQTFPQLKISAVVQDQGLGLGHALLMAQRLVASRPFAVILPDEIDDSSQSLAEVLHQYELVRRPVIAVNHDSIRHEIPHLLRYFGFAALGRRLSRGIELYYLKQELIEKPGIPMLPSHLHKIAGRYVLTPEIFAFLLEGKDRSEGPVRYELTDALNKVWRTPRSLCAYRLQRDLVPLTPIRSIIDQMESDDVFSAERYKRLAKR
jgi:UTP-glucose-1-phosphate uridylyltransferase/DNA-binding Xre family transcriptional regulator